MKATGLVALAENVTERMVERLVECRIEVLRDPQS
jgi:hypothetical protein